MRFHSRETAYEWPSNPHDYMDQSRQTPYPLQGASRYGKDAINVTDPMSRLSWPAADVPRRAGDRILVQKYLYSIRNPHRWDVIVFKGPEEPKTNFIKRLVGLPNEQIVLVDGDVFVRATNAAGEPREEWSIQRKSHRAQNALWATVYSSEFAPLRSEYNGRPWRNPWNGQGWTAENGSFRYAEAGGGTLAWNHSIPVTDSVPYNWTFPSLRAAEFPVSDLRMRAIVTPDNDAAAITAHLSVRKHQFEARITGDGQAELVMRSDADGAPEQILATGATGAIRANVAVDIEFWHVDQRLTLFVNGDVVCESEYNWTPEERISFSMRELDSTRRQYAQPSQYLRPQRIEWSVSGPATVTRVGLDRDLYYQSRRSGSRYDRASAIVNPMTLGPDEFFVLGDNSPFSRDARMWTRVDPWVAFQYDDTPGIVPRSLIMGKAFFVYFPAPHRGARGLPVPDFGRLRFIR
jgi:signal peptidase I